MTPLTKESLIILDFDHALFNTKEFKEQLRAIFIRHGVSKDVFEDTYDEIREHEDSQYSFERHISILEGRIFDRKKLAAIKKEVLKLLRETDKFLFPDTIDFLKRVSKSYKLILVSFGEREFQMLKIDSSGIIKYFMEIIIARGRKLRGTKDLEVARVIDGHQNRKIVFIEDVAENIDLIKKDYPDVMTIKIERPGAKYSKTKSENVDYIVQDLEEAEEIIDKVCKNA